MGHMGTYAACIRAHHIGRFAAAVIGPTPAGAVAFAVDLAHTAGESGYDLFGTVHGHLLAGTYRGERRRRVATKAAGLEDVGVSNFSTVEGNVMLRMTLTIRTLRA